jgi:hypothetical protein
MISSINRPIKPKPHDGITRKKSNKKKSSDKWKKWKDARQTLGGCLYCIAASLDKSGTIGPM